MSLLLSRYILEIEQDVSLFRKYENGWYPNFDKYYSFFHKQEKNNEHFSKLIDNYHLIKENYPILETVMDANINNVSTYLKKEYQPIFSSYGSINISTNYPTVDLFSYYISNGIYEITQKLALEVYAKSGKFIVGVCDNPDSMFYQENLFRIKELEKLLRKKNIEYDKLSHKNHRDKCIILMNRSKAL